MSKKKVLVISGPNLNLLGAREKDIYGDVTLKEIYLKMMDISSNKDLIVECKQSNSESEIIDFIQDAQSEFDGIIINAGGYTHTSVSIRDALKYFDGYIIEIHMSNIHAREEFRKISMISGVSDGLIVGFGPDSYYLALKAITSKL
ncbi:MAG: type II 3-dehydroquinate dehydratase [Candidatus Puniceispirillales bacterium]|tara:strand:+ start:493 stop:930 length:438 start_codon:yes stop_codon:yes gene_type:complete